MFCSAKNLIAVNTKSFRLRVAGTTGVTCSKSCRYSRNSRAFYLQSLSQSGWYSNFNVFIRLSRDSYIFINVTNTYLCDCALHSFMAEEFFKYLNCCVTEITVAKRYEQVELHVCEQRHPLLDLLFFEVLLKARIENLNVSPLQVLQLVLLNILFECLSDIK